MSPSALTRNRLILALSISAVFILDFRNPPATGAQLHVPSRDDSGSRITYEGGDGSTCDRAVVIGGARNTADAIRAERKWLAERYPDAKITSTALVQERSRTFEVFTLLTPGSARLTVCFDVTSSFGTW